MNYVKLATAIAAAVGAAQAGIVALPIADPYKAFVAFGLGLAATFFAVLLQGDKTP